MTFSRRELLRMGAVLLVPCLSACGERGDRGDADAGDGDGDGDGDGLPYYEYDGPLGPEGTFSHGVASGDPLTDAVILWTRVSPDGSAELEVFVEVALDPEFQERVAAAYYSTGADKDFTLKVDLDDLEPATTYYYRFYALGRQSGTGRTKTAPATAPDRLRFAVVSCSNYTYGWFHVYRAIAARAELDAVIHLGDYIYEYAVGEYGTAGEVRDAVPAHETVTLDDYRQRYAQYRTDPDLQEVHRQHPFIVVWDDHECADNGWSGGAENHSEGSEGTWTDRLAASKQAFAEWIPIREMIAGEIYRELRFGGLVDLMMLDTRITGRQAQVSISDPALQDPDRQMLGAPQESWLQDRLSSSTATWKVLGQQVMFGHYQGLTNTDAWDGYPAARDRLLAHVEGEDVGNLVVLTGDIHSSWVMEIARDPFDPEIYDPDTGAGVLGVEFVTPAVTSPGFPAALAPNVESAALVNNPHMRWVEVTSRGFVLVEFTAAAVTAAWYHIDDVSNPEAGTMTFVSGWSAQAGVLRLMSAPEPADLSQTAPRLAPEAASETRVRPR